MSEVVLNIYDVTNSGSGKTNNVIVQLNRILKDGIGIGGIFHSAVQIYGEEWSFGYCENGSGVFSCPPRKNPMYTYRESIVLGDACLSGTKVNQILTELRTQWPGYSYDLLSKNCNHFCDIFCENLGVQKLPAWINRFANVGGAAVDVAGSTALRLRQAKTDVISASKVAYRFLLGNTSTSSDSVGEGSIQDVTSTSGGNNLRHVSWFKNLGNPRTSVRFQDASPRDQLEE